MTKKSRSSTGSAASTGSTAADPDLKIPREKTRHAGPVADPERNVDHGTTASVEGPVEQAASAVETEKPGVLTRAQIEAARNWRRKGKSLRWTAKAMGVSKSSILKYTRDIVATGEDSDDESQPSASNIAAMQNIARKGLDRFEIQKLTGFSLDVIDRHVAGIVPQIESSVDHPVSPPPVQPPRLSYEVAGAVPPPKIVEEENNGHSGPHNSQAFPMATEYHDGPVSPARVLVSPDDPSLQSILLELLHLSAIRNIPFEKYLRSGMAAEDIRDTAYAKTLVPSDGSQFRENLLMFVRKSNLHDKLRRESGLERGDWQ